MARTPAEAGKMNKTVFVFYTDCRDPEREQELREMRNAL